jgi:hypothetical protein
LYPLAACSLLTTVLASNAWCSFSLHKPLCSNEIHRLVGPKRERYRILKTGIQIKKGVG